MRLILGFIFFGFLFYAIWYFFPEAFNTMVSWVSKIFDFIRDLFNGIVGGNHVATTPTATPVVPLPAH